MECDGERCVMVSLSNHPEQSAVGAQDEGTT
jgi:hypothetical protein